MPTPAVDPVESLVGASAAHGVRRVLIRHALLSVLLLALVAVGATFWSRHLAKDESLRDAANLGETMATTVVRPVVTEGLYRQDPAAIAAVDRVVRPQLAAGGILLGKIWQPDGTVLYATDSNLIGRRFELEPDVKESFGAAASADVTEMDRAENVLDLPDGPQIEVYAPFEGPGGRQLMYEVYVPIGLLPSGERVVVREVLPLALGVLVALGLLQLPLTVSLLRRLNRAEEGRRRVLERGATALEAERRRLARFLHDDVIQDLSGVAYALTAMPAALPAGTSESVESVLAESARAVRRDVGLLRGLLVDLYPARLAEIGLAAAVEGLLRPLREQGLLAELDAPDDLQPAAPVAAVLYNVVREALRNVEKHAGASTVKVLLVQEGDRVQAVVSDDGRGFEPLPAGEPSADDGPGGTQEELHFGLRLMHDSVRDLGGRLMLRSTLGRGTEVRAELPMAIGAEPAERPTVVAR